MEMYKFIEDANKAEKKRLSEMEGQLSERVSTGDMLSSQAKAGLAGNEVRAAMDVLNIAKQSLTTLKQIARNTGRDNRTYAPG